MSSMASPVGKAVIRAQWGRLSHHRCTLALPGQRDAQGWVHVVACTVNLRKYASSGRHASCPTVVIRESESCVRKTMWVSLHLPTHMDVQYRNPFFFSPAPLPLQTSPRRRGMCKGMDGKHTRATGRPWHAADADWPSLAWSQRRSVDPVGRMGTRFLLGATT